MVRMNSGNFNHFNSIESVEIPRIEETTFVKDVQLADYKYTGTLLDGIPHGYGR